MDNSNETPQPELLPLPEVKKYVPVKDTKLWELIWSGELPSKKIGRRVYVTREDLNAFIESLPSGSRTDGRAS